MASDKQNREEEQLCEYVRNCAIRRVLEYYGQRLEDIIEDLDEQIAEQDKTPTPGESEALLIVRNRLNSARIDLDLIAASAKTKAVMFEKERDLAK